jgi:hypothetical protein
MDKITFKVSKAYIELYKNANGLEITTNENCVGAKYSNDENLYISLYGDSSFIDLCEYYNFKTLIFDDDKILKPNNKYKIVIEELI